MCPFKCLKIVQIGFFFGKKWRYFNWGNYLEVSFLKKNFKLKLQYSKTIWVMKNVYFFLKTTKYNPLLTSVNTKVLKNFFIQCSFWNCKKKYYSSEINKWCRIFRIEVVQKPKTRRTKLFKTSLLLLTHIIFSLHMSKQFKVN